MILTKKKEEYYILMSTSIGDDVYGMAYIRELKIQSGKSIIVYCHEHKRRLIENYTDVVDDIRCYPKGYKGWVRINYSIFLIDIARKFGIYSIMPHHYIPLERNEGRSCLNIIWKDMLCFEREPMKQYPDFSKELITSIPIQNTGGGKIVILNYSSQFMSNVDLSIFEFIAEDLTKRGYVVYSNVIREQQPIKYTKALNCSIYEFYAICNHIAAVISVRSGILDLAANTNASFLVYNFPFPNKSRQYNEEWMARYTLKAWDKKNLIETLVYNKEEEIKVYQEFLKEYLNSEVP